MKVGQQVQIFYNDTPDHVCVLKGTLREINDTYLKAFDVEHGNTLTIMFSRIVRVVE